MSCRNSASSVGLETHLREHQNRAAALAPLSGAHDTLVLACGKRVFGELPEGTSSCASA